MTPQVVSCSPHLSTGLCWPPIGMCRSWAGARGGSKARFWAPWTLWQSREMAHRHP